MIRHVHSHPPQPSPASAVACTVGGLQGVTLTEQVPSDSVANDVMHEVARIMLLPTAPTRPTNLVPACTLMNG